MRKERLASLAARAANKYTTTGDPRALAKAFRLKVRVTRAQNRKTKAGQEINKRVNWKVVHQLGKTKTREDQLKGGRHCVSGSA